MDEEEPDVELHPYRAEEADKARERLSSLRRERQGEKVQQSLDGVKRAAAKGENVMPAVMQAVSAYATVGEIMGALKQEYGQFKEPVRF